ncbi:hypothetical protein [Asaia bogorensis]|uniref:hypothetical protein n=1 Tax=Asaia bogorensis TaxID=91915 RepID=UPI000EFCA35C|nr:hypothetical protein [Asaia bogorensis]
MSGTTTLSSGGSGAASADPAASATVSGATTTKTATVSPAPDYAYIPREPLTVLGKGCPAFAPITDAATITEIEATGQVNHCTRVSAASLGG